MSRETIRDRIYEHVIPTDIRVFYEDGRPYIYYKGKLASRSEEWEIEIPKMDMAINTLERVTVVREDVNLFGQTLHIAPVCSEFFAVHDIAYRMRKIKKKMTKQDIERELGYKVDIIGE